MLKLNTLKALLGSKSSTVWHLGLGLTKQSSLPNFVLSLTSILADNRLAAEKFEGLKWGVQVGHFENGAFVCSMSPKRWNDAATFFGLEMPFPRMETAKRENYSKDQLPTLFDLENYWDVWPSIIEMNFSLLTSFKKRFDCGIIPMSGS